MTAAVSADQSGSTTVKFARKLNELSPTAAVQFGLKDAITGCNHLLMPYINGASIDNGTAVYLHNMPAVCQLIC